LARFRIRWIVDTEGLVNTHGKQGAVEALRKNKELLEEQKNKGIIKNVAYQALTKKEKNEGKTLPYKGWIDMDLSNGSMDASKIPASDFIHTSVHEIMEEEEAHSEIRRYISKIQEEK